MEVFQCLYILSDSAKINKRRYLRMISEIPPFIRKFLLKMGEIEQYQRFLSITNTDTLLVSVKDVFWKISNFALINNFIYTLVIKVDISVGFFNKMK